MGYEGYEGIFFIFFPATCNWKVTPLNSKFGAPKLRPRCNRRCPATGYNRTWSLSTPLGDRTGVGNATKKRGKVAGKCRSVGLTIWISDWWFGTFLIFACIGNNHPNWLVFFRGVGIPPTRSHRCLLKRGECVGFVYHIFLRTDDMRPLFNFSTCRKARTQNFEKHRVVSVFFHIILAPTKEYPMQPLNRCDIYIILHLLICYLPCSYLT